MKSIDFYFQKKSGITWIGFILWTEIIFKKPFKYINVFQDLEGSGYKAQ